MNMPLSRSWEIAEAIASSRPAAVDSAAASPPAATSAITQLGSLAISGLASTMMSRSTLTISLDRVVSAVLDPAVAVLVLECEQTGLFPVLEPLGPLLDHQVLAGLRLNGVDQVEARHAGYRRGRGVQDRDEDQRPAGGRARVAHLRYGEEADDHVGQTRGTDHQRHGVGEHVQAASRTSVVYS